MSFSQEGRYSNATQNPLLPIIYAALRCFCDDHEDLPEDFARVNFQLAFHPLTSP